jgi:hypothetical protein
MCRQFDSVLRFELPNPKERIYSPPRLATSLPLQKMVPARGLEPAIYYGSVAQLVEQWIEAPCVGSSILS